MEKGIIVSNLFVDTPQKGLSWLLKQIHKRKIAFHGFQRDFLRDFSLPTQLIVSKDLLNREDFEKAIFSVQASATEGAVPALHRSRCREIDRGYHGFRLVATSSKKRRSILGSISKEYETSCTPRYGGTC